MKIDNLSFFFSIILNLLLFTFSNSDILESTSEVQTQTQSQDFPKVRRKIKDFRSNPLGGSIKEGLYPVDLELVEFENSRVVSYIDFNADKYNDLVVCTTSVEGDEIIEFHIYNFELGLFEKSTVNIMLNKGEILNNLSAIDLDNNDSLDLIVTVKTKEAEKHIFYVGTKLETDKFTSKFERNTFELVNKGILIADLEGSSIKTILYYDEVEKERVYVFLDANNEFKKKKFSDLINKDNILGENFNKLPLELNNSSSFVDIDGDCVNDLLINSYDEKSKKRYLEIWRGKVVEEEKTKRLTFFLVEDSIYEMSKDIGSFSISDINRDGMLDLIFVLLNTEPKALIAYNKINYVNYWDGDYCLNNHYSSNKFTKIFNPFSSKVSDNNVINVPVTQKYDLSNWDATKNQIINLYGESDVYHANEKYGIYPSVRMGDINTDSYADFIITLENKGKRTSKVFINCKQEVNLGATTEDINIRNYAGKCHDSEEEFKFENSESKEVYSSFFDLDENGQLDILVVRQVEDKFQIQAYLNNFHYDAFFLKSLSTHKSQKYASIAIGVTYRYIATSLNGSRRLDVNYQAIQLNNMSLYLPYTFIGIGRSNNYVENFHVISPTFTKDVGNNYKIFTPIIPNSQLLISDEKGWSLDLIVNPTNMLFLIIGVIIIILVLLLLLIVYLHCQELKEDQVNDNMIFTTWFN